MTKIVEHREVTTHEYTLTLNQDQAAFLVGLLDYVRMDDQEAAGFDRVYDALSSEVEEQPSWNVTTEASPFSDVIRISPKD